MSGARDSVVRLHTSFYGVRLKSRAWLLVDTLLAAGCMPSTVFAVRGQHTLASLCAATSSIFYLRVRRWTGPGRFIAWSNVPQVFGPRLASAASKALIDHTEVGRPAPMELSYDVRLPARTRVVAS